MTCTKHNLYIEDDDSRVYCIECSQEWFHR